jgi:hypothetical protein
MVAAVNAVREKDMGLKNAEISFNVPRSTLKDYAKKGEHDVEKRVLGNLGRKPVLPSELENEFVKFCLNMEKKFFGLFHSNISERRVGQGTAVPVTGYPHKQKAIEERGRKKARESTELAAEAKKRTQQKKGEASTAKKSASRKSTERQQKRRGKKRATSPPSSSSSEDDDDVISLVETDDEDSDDDAQCSVCDKFFSNDKHGETWFQCSKCRNWCHSICGGDICLEGHVSQNLSISYTDRKLRI